MVHIDGAFLQIDVMDRQTNELRYPEARFEQEIDTVVVFGEVLIILYKFQKSTFLFSCDGFPCYAVVYNDCSKLKRKWILAYQIIIDCHLKSWSNNTPDWYGLNCSFAHPSAA